MCLLRQAKPPEKKERPMSDLKDPVLTTPNHEPNEPKMDINQLVKDLIANPPEGTSSITINIATPGAPIYNCIGVQFVGANPSRKSKRTEEAESEDAIEIDLDDDEDGNVGDYVSAQSGTDGSNPLPDLDETPEADSVDVDALVEVAEEKGFPSAEVPKLRVFIAANPTGAASAISLAEDEIEAEDDVTDIASCLKDVGFDLTPD
jgi:hypothetical protein